MIAYETVGICVELWKNRQLVQTWDWRKDSKVKIVSMVTNENDLIGVIYSLGQSPFRHFMILERSLECLKSCQQDTLSFESVYPFGDVTWYLKDTLGKYHRFKKDKDEWETVKFAFPCGLQQRDNHGVVIGATASDIQFCDFV